MTKKESNLILFSITLCWASSYIFIKDLPDDLSSYAYLTLTAGIAGIILLLIFHKALRKLDRKTVFRGMILAMLIAGNMLLEKIGLTYIPSSTASFLASLNIMVVPIILLLFRKFPTKNNIVGIVIILGGLLVSNGISTTGTSFTGISFMLGACVIMSIYTDVAVTLNVFMFVEILFLFYMEKRITIPIENLADLAKEYVKLDEEKLNTKQFVDACKPYEKDQTEVGKLARSYAQMVTDLNAYMTHLTQITAEKERIGTELALATKIQADMLPCIFHAFPERKEFVVYATMNPAKEVGGDFYDFFMVDDRHLAVVMADVSGKGVPAALFMVIGKTLIKDHTRPNESLGTVFSDVNDLLCDAD